MLANTLTVADCCAPNVPLLAVTASHAPPTLVLAVACHVMLPPPVLVTVIACAVGLGCPITPVKAIEAGVLARIGVVGGPIVSVTGSVCVPSDELRRIPAV